jgi:predicted RNase H-like HicB family nuclease
MNRNPQMGVKNLTKDADRERITRPSEEKMHGNANIEAGSQPAPDWPDHIKVSIWVVKEAGHWSALASEFNVVGMGNHHDEALENLRENLSAYLVSYAEEGAPFSKAQRRIPVRESLRLWALALLTFLARKLTPHKQRHQFEYTGPRAVEHSREDFGSARALHC